MKGAWVEVDPEWLASAQAANLADRLFGPVEGGRISRSDLSDLADRVEHRLRRLERLHELSAPPIIIRNEKRKLGLEKAIHEILEATTAVQQ